MLFRERKRILMYHEFLMSKRRKHRQNYTLSFSFRDIIIRALQFYNDEHDMLNIQIKEFRKSRKKKHDTNE